MYALDPIHSLRAQSPRVLSVLSAALGLVSCILDRGPDSEPCDAECSTAEAPAKGSTDAAGDQGTGALASILAETGGEYVDDLEADADGLPPEFAGIIGEFMALEDFPGAFAQEDLRRVHILPESHPGAGRFLTGDHSAITLDSLVIFEDERYDAILSWDRSWEDVLAGALSPEEDRALFTTLHELVHVRQFREAGRERFLSEYLAEALANGEHSVEFEREAYAIAPRDDSWARQAIASAR